MDGGKTVASTSVPLIAFGRAEPELANAIRVDDLKSLSIHDRSLISEYLSGLERLAQSSVIKPTSDLGQASRAISTGQLHALLRFHTQPIKLLVSECSSGTEVQGDLVLRPASHLDAFSGYPIRT